MVNELVGVFGLVLLLFQKHVLQHCLSAAANELDLHFSLHRFESIEELIPSTSALLGFRQRLDAELDEAIFFLHETMQQYFVVVHQVATDTRVG